MSFAKDIYRDAQSLFEEGEVQVMVCRQPGEPVGRLSPEVRLVHQPSGIEITCGEFPTQTENYIAAALRLRIACDRRGG